MIILSSQFDDLLFGYLFATIASLLLLGFTISIAAGTSRRNKHNKIIIKLLASIAEKNGVDHEKLVNLIKDSEK